MKVYTFSVKKTIFPLYSRYNLMKNRDFSLYLSKLSTKIAVYL